MPQAILTFPKQFERQALDFAAKVNATGGTAIAARQEDVYIVNARWEVTDLTRLAIDLHRRGFAKGKVHER